MWVSKASKKAELGDGVSRLSTQEAEAGPSLWVRSHPSQQSGFQDCQNCYTRKPCFKNQERELPGAFISRWVKHEKRCQNRAKISSFSVTRVFNLLTLGLQCFNQKGRSWRELLFQFPFSYTKAEKSLENVSLMKLICTWKQLKVRRSTQSCSH